MAVRESEVRRAEIVRLAKTSGLASVDELSAQFGVTASTIRRDLSHLTTRGLLARTYGGAIALDPHPESSIRQRAVEGFDAKRAIAKWAAGEVHPGETVLLDAGTTVGAMGEFLRDCPRLTVITAGLTALESLADADDVRVECLGGTLRHLSQGFVGPLAEASLARVSYDRAFLGADAVTADRGICEAEIEQTRLKELMMDRAGSIYVLAHAAKLGRRPFHAWAPLPAGVTLVTDATATAADTAPFEDAGIVVVRV
ncbi:MULTISPECIES: DeoR/GlpR family DNA-binding transcription regulator [Nocardiaceae]|uniref:DeoR/GlpR transcriptional regulator n=1 Tax=Rhodococcoides kroppenstedtii TaxID=293050 RepID=A0ABS7NPV6_9NOCA|nr:MULTISPECIES: DeoR/GlpR family DNA-binding transcription regulator [Rhodococcus]AMY18114.1 Glucitol operon repressor [Rhodococcus sp. PBTS 1]MBY6313710.1 DeoR/GlpR transcriptional regulator [Rhodococcus kroppenstedtii]MBY6320026.1 DeoR/GlpR transcriptional regulator [Rhodococcus kroppenstedtii]MBY6398965.1 DeoR/GlpR transcriptional regulator [Rhodococcus kroppenstedtii]